MAKQYARNFLDVCTDMRGYGLPFCHLSPAGPCLFSRRAPLCARRAALRGIERTSLVMLEGREGNPL